MILDSECGHMGRRVPDIEKSPGPEPGAGEFHREKEGLPLMILLDHFEAIPGKSAVSDVSQSLKINRHVLL